MRPEEKADAMVDAALERGIREAFERRDEPEMRAIMDSIDLPWRRIDPDLLRDAARIMRDPRPAFRLLLASGGADPNAVIAFARDRSLPAVARANALAGLAAHVKLSGADPAAIRAEALAIASELLDEAAGRALLGAADVLGDFVFRQEIMDKLRAGGLGWIPGIAPEVARKAPGAVSSGLPIRRAAPKLGRNDPCPCGSGKKVKHCCGDRAGGPRAGVSAATPPPRDLSRAALSQLDGPTISSFDPRALTPQQLDDVASALARRGAFDDAERFVAELQSRGQRIEGVLWTLFEEALDFSEFDAAARYLGPLPDDEDKQLAALELGIYRSQEEGEDESLQQLEEMAEEAVTGSQDAIRLAESITKSLPALGLLIARAACLDRDAIRWPGLYHDILCEAREWLDLPGTGDPAEKLLWPDGPPSAPAPVPAPAPAPAEPEITRDEIERVQADRRRALEELAARNREVRLLRRRMEDLEREVQTAAQRPTSRGGAADSQSQELRDRVERLQAEIRAQQGERRRLRQALGEERRRAERLARETGAAAGKAARPEDEDDEEVPDEAAGMAEPDAAIAPAAAVPLIPSFSPRFEKDVAELPPAVGGLALRRLIGLAVGDPKDCRQAKPLVKMRNVARDFYSLRVGIHHRLIVDWVPGESLRAEALIRRADLERTLREWS